MLALGALVLMVWGIRRLLIRRPAEDSVYPRQAGARRRRIEQR